MPVTFRSSNCFTTLLATVALSLFFAALFVFPHRSIKVDDLRPFVPVAKRSPLETTIQNIAAPNGIHSTIELGSTTQDASLSQDLHIGPTITTLPPAIIYNQHAKCESVFTSDTTHITVWTDFVNENGAVFLSEVAYECSGLNGWSYTPVQEVIMAPGEQRWVANEEWEFELKLSDPHELRCVGLAIMAVGGPPFAEGCSHNLDLHKSPESGKEKSLSRGAHIWINFTFAFGSPSHSTISDGIHDIMRFADSNGGILALSVFREMRHAW